MTAKIKKPTITEVKAGIKKNFGKNAIIDLTKRLDIEVYPTNSLKLNLLFGVGGFPKGKIIEIYGGESSGKTTLATQILVELQKNKGVGAFIDVEHAFNPQYAEALGLNLKKLIFMQPDSAEDALNRLIALIESKGVDLVVLDSVAALSPQKELDGGMGDETMGLLARIMGKMLRKIRAIANENGVTVVFINQIRSNMKGYGDPETTAGGRALKFFSTIRLKLSASEKIKVDNEMIGQKTRFFIAKNKVGSPHKKAIINLYYGEGFSHEAEIIDYAMQFGIIHKQGSWIYDSDTGETMGQGYENLRRKMLEDHELAATLEKAVIDYVDIKRKEKDEQDEE